jgi:hypothetical protein
VGYVWSVFFGHFAKKGKSPGEALDYMEDAMTGGNCKLKCLIPSPWDLGGSVTELSGELAGKSAKMIVSRANAAAGALDTLACFVECDREENENSITCPAETS